MKKFLSLVLAMIMVMSLVTVGAGAAFTDAAKITNAEAVEVMSALGILKGDGDSFDPTGTLTRGAAAKIITYMVNGTAKADAIAAAGLAEKPFPDVPTTSATAPFIAYCAEQGIVGGYKDGTFQRSNPVTGNAFIKMVLKALGENEIDFTAKGWEVEAVAKAEEMDLLEGIEETVKFSENLTRENAAQIAFNGMKYVPEGSRYWVVSVVGKDDVKFADATEAAMYAMMVGGEVTPKKNLNESLAGKNYNMDVMEELVIIATPETRVDLDHTLAVKFAEIGDLENAEIIDLNFVADKALIGNVVNVYFQDKDADGAHYYTEIETKLDKSETIYSVAPISTAVTVKKTTGLTYKQVNTMLGIDDLTKAATVPSTENGVKHGTVLLTTPKLTNLNTRVNLTSGNAVTYEDMPLYHGLTLAAGTYIVYENDLVMVKSSASTVDMYGVKMDKDGEFEIYMNNAEASYKLAENNCYEGKLVYKSAEDKEDRVEILTNKLDWASMVEQANEEVDVVLNTTYVGDFLTVSVPKTTAGKVTKVDFSGSTKYIYIGETKTQLDPIANNEIVAELTEATGETAIATNYTNDFGDLYINEYKFFLDAEGHVFAYQRNDGTVITEVIIPTLIYGKYEYNESAEDEYGIADEKNLSNISVWLQAVDMNGKVVNLQITDTTDLDPAVNPAYAGLEEAEVKALAKAAADAVIADAGRGFEIGEFATYTVTEGVANVVAGGEEGTIVSEQMAVGTDVKSTAKKVDVVYDVDKDASVYLSESFKVIYIKNLGQGSKMEISVKDGTNAQIVEGAQLYAETSKKDNGVLVLKYVVITTEPAGVVGDEVLYLNAALNKNIKVPYVDPKTGKDVEAYLNTAYINGEKTTIMVTSSTITDINAAMTETLKGGFFRYEIKEDGICELDATSYNLAGTEFKVELTENFKGLLTAGVANAYNATNAKIVNLLSNNNSNLGYDDVPTAASKLETTGYDENVTTKTVLSFIYDATEEEISLIYVITYPDQDAPNVPKA